MYKQLIIQLILIKCFVSTKKFNSEIDNFAIKVNPNLDQVCINNTLGKFKMMLNNAEIPKLNDKCFGNRGPGQIKINNFEFLFDYSTEPLNVGNILRYQTTDKIVYIEISPVFSGLNALTEFQCFILNISPESLSIQNIAQKNGYLMIKSPFNIYYSCKFPTISKVSTALLPLRYQLMPKFSTQSKIANFSVHAYRKFVVLDLKYEMKYDFVFVSIFKLNGECVKSFRVFENETKIKSLKENPACMGKPVEDLKATVSRSKISFVFDTYKPLEPFTQYNISLKIFQMDKETVLHRIFMTPKYKDSFNFNYPFFPSFQQKYSFNFNYPFFPSFQQKWSSKERKIPFTGNSIPCKGRMISILFENKDKLLNPKPKIIKIKELQKIIRKSITGTINYPYYYLECRANPDQIEIFQIPYKGEDIGNYMIFVKHASDLKRFDVKWNFIPSKRRFFYMYWFFMIEIYNSDKETLVDKYFYECGTCSQQMLKNVREKNKKLAKDFTKSTKNYSVKFMAFDTKFQITTDELPSNINMKVKVHGYTETDRTTIKSSKPLSIGSSWWSRNGSNLLIGIFTPIAIICLFVCICFFLCKESPDDDKMNGPHQMNLYSKD